MPNKLQEFAERSVAELLQKLPPEQRVQGLSPEDRLRGLSLEQFLQGLPPEQRQALARLLRENESPPSEG
jgi:DNA-directed RNA polymerase specialized sigma24 family protein